MELEVGNKTYTVTTPEDHPWGYCPAWRHEVAKLVSSADRITYPGRKDDYISRQITYLRYLSDPDNARNQKRMGEKERQPYKFAYDIFDENELAKAQLDSLLLCPELTLQAVAGFSNLPPVVVKTYERLYYNIRNDDGVILESPWIRQFFASSNQVRHDPGDWKTHWRLLAFEGGHTLLFSIWHWPVELNVEADVLHNRTLANNAFTDLEHRSRYHMLGNRDLVELYGNLRQATVDMRNRGLIAGTGAERDLLYQFMEMMAPHPTEVSQASLQEKQIDLTRKIEIMKRLSAGTPANSVVSQASAALANIAARKNQTTITIQRTEEALAVGP